MDYPQYIIGIDPGVTTGVAVMALLDSEYKLVDTFQWKDPDFVWEKIHELIVSHKEEVGPERVTVLCESFEVRPDVLDPDETPKYIIKDLERYVEPEHEIRYQQASVAKVGVPPAKSGRPDRLKAFGLYQRGYRHANDAIRHIVAYAIEKLRYRPLIVAGWGVPGKK